MIRLLVLVPLSLVLLVPATARANISAVYAGGVLAVASNDAGTTAETVAITQEGANVAVTTNAGLIADPDAGGVCSNPVAGKVVCSAGSLAAVNVSTGTGVDTITDANTSTPTLLQGGAAGDTISTSGGDTEADIRGEAGNDQLTMRSEDDVVDGGAENDTLTAAGESRFAAGSSLGGPGNDTFIGNPDDEDYVEDEPGADTYNLGTRVPGALEAPDAFFQTNNYADSIQYTSAVPISVSLDGVANDGAAGELDNVGTDVEYVYGGNAGNTLVAGPHRVAFYGGDGNDQLIGGPGPDSLIGGGGSDTLLGGDGDDSLVDGDFTQAIIVGPQPTAGNDVLDGGGGADELGTDRGADDVRGGPGVDRMSLSRPIPQAPAVTTPIVPAGFTVSLDDVANDGQTGAGEGDNFHSDIEVVTTFDGDDVITGTGSSEEISTGKGNDVVDPGGGPDLVELGAGDDRVTAEDQATDTVRCGDGADTATADLPGAQAVRADVLSDCEAVSGTPFPVVVPPSPPVLVPTPVVVTGGDRTKPTVTLGSATIKARDFLADGRLELTVRCNEACSVEGEAFTTLARIAKAGDFSVGTGELRRGTGRRTLRITVAKKYRNRFKRKLRTKAQKRRGVKFSVVVEATDAAGNVTKATRTVTVKG